MALIMNLNKSRSLYKDGVRYSRECLMSAERSFFRVGCLGGDCPQRFLGKFKNIEK